MIILFNSDGVSGYDNSDDVAPGNNLHENSNNVERSRNDERSGERNSRGGPHRNNNNRNNRDGRDNDRRPRSNDNRDNSRRNDNQEDHHDRSFTGKSGFYFVPIGGSDEIGMNCLLYICDEEIVIVDLGIGFPFEMPGVQVVVPDLSFIFSKKQKVVAIVITHIHEDHCGAVAYLLKYLPNIPIYATRFCLNFMSAKLDEAGHREKVDFMLMSPEKKFKVGSKFEITPYSLTHSTPEMCALLINTSYGNIFHTADWKMDNDPVVGTPIDRAMLKRLGDSGIDAMVCDSTNIGVPGRSKDEGTLKGDIEEIVRNAPNRILISLFASNVGRISTILSVAKKLHKKICLVGRAVGRVINAAKDSGYLEEFDESMFLNEVEAISHAPSELMILCTGCQAEVLAALTKIVYGNHRHLNLLKDDTIVFSAKTIPGNEKRVSNLYNAIIRFGATLITQDTHNVHVSGHAAIEEVKEMYDLIRPSVAIPVHGEAIHNKKHCDLARSKGVKKVISVRNGDVLRIGSDIEAVEKVTHLKSGFLCVDGKLFRKEFDPVIKARKRIMEDGVLFVILHINRKDQRTPVKAKLFAPGLLDEGNDSAIMNDLVIKIEKEIEATIETGDRKTDFSYLTIITAKKFCKNRLGKSPLIKVELIFK